MMAFAKVTKMRLCFMKTQHLPSIEAGETAAMRSEDERE